MSPFSLPYRAALLAAGLGLASLPAAASDPAQTPHQHASTPAPLASPIAVPLDAATLAGLPRAAATGSSHGQNLQCEGVPLSALLRAAGALPEQGLRGAGLSRYVLITARDGYRVIYSLAELDPTLGNKQTLLADRCDGKPLDDQDGPLRLISADESRAARWVRQVQSITVVVAP